MFSRLLCVCVITFVSASLWLTSPVAAKGPVAPTLTTNQQKELIVFGVQAMGINKGVNDVQHLLTMPQLLEGVAVGIMLNGHLCFKVITLRPLTRHASAYEATCVMYRDGIAQQAYILDAMRGTAFRP